MKNKRKIYAVILVVLGVLVLAYPPLSNGLSRINGSYAIQTLSQQLARVDGKELQHQLELAQDYNASLSGNLEDGTDPADYEKILDFGNGIMGYLRIPKIDVELPIYHTTEEAVLVKGVGHLPQSAFPIGGIGNHAVLSGHTGLPEAKLFTDLDKVEIGDMFYVHVLDQTMAYQVDQIKVVLPNRGEDLLADKDLDLCTLVTCTPYGINSHRLLVRGVRTQMQENQQQPAVAEITDGGNGILWFFIPFVALIFGAGMIRNKKERGK